MVTAAKGLLDSSFTRGRFPSVFQGSLLPGRARLWTALLCLFYSCFIQKPACANDYLFNGSSPPYLILQKEKAPPPIIYSIPLGTNDIVTPAAGWMWYLGQSSPWTDCSGQTSHEWTWSHGGKIFDDSKASHPPIEGLSLDYFRSVQQRYLLELLDLSGITAHENKLDNIVNMTQMTGSRHLTDEQVEQSQDWRRTEGEDIRETHAGHDSALKSQFIDVLSRMNYYNALRVQDQQKYHFTLFLGGSIQEMQWRMLTLLAVVDNYGSPGEINLGKLVALTCDRHIVTMTEAQDTSEVKNTFFPIRPVNGKPMVEVGPGETLVHLEDLTEDSAYRAIYYSLVKMCEDPHYFARRRETSTGFHPPGYLSRNSPELPYYQYQEDGGTYILTDAFRETACRFTRKYGINTFSVLEKAEGVNIIKRPTTKRTVRDWALAPLAGEQLHVCQDKRLCRVLAISNQPSARYQQMAVYQGLQDTLPEHWTGTDLLPEITVHLTAAGTSTGIPTDAILNNLTRHLYLISVHPED
ncbi:MAG: hypothetical protein ACR2PT_18540 [Endozoicomonas sp.]